jgi:DNA-3-methyladenine glycosylase I
MNTPCPWAPRTDALYAAYHDTEWGVPEHDDRALYEKLVLDGFQAGLSWRTILYKRDNFRTAFDGFDPERVARYGPRDVERLLGDAGIIRHRGKIEGAIRNAQLWLDMMSGGGPSFADHLWSFFGDTPRQNRWRTFDEVPATTPEGDALAKDLKKRGFKFCGPTIVYAFAQAVGMVNDHLVGCPEHGKVAALAHRP